MSFYLTRDLDLKEIPGSGLIHPSLRILAGMVVMEALIFKFYKDFWIESIIFEPASEDAYKVFEAGSLLLVTAQVSKRGSRYDPLKINKYTWGPHEENEGGLFEAKGYYQPGEEQLYKYLVQDKPFDQDLSLVR